MLLQSVTAALQCPAPVGAPTNSQQGWAGRGHGNPYATNPRTHFGASAEEISFP